MLQLSVIISSLHSSKESNELANKTSKQETQWQPGSAENPEMNGAYGKLLTWNSRQKVNYEDKLVMGKTRPKQCCNQQ